MLTVGDAGAFVTWTVGDAGAFGVRQLLPAVGVAGALSCKRLDSRC